mgnify:CR=1 FL=1
MATEPRWSDYDCMLEASLREDRADDDATTRALVPEGLRGKGHIVARQNGVICGLPLARRLAGWVDTSLHVRECIPDGVPAETGATVAVVSGPARSILTVERTMLNFLQRLSGTATLASRYAGAVEGTGARILDTRKTTPGWRALEKYAVRCGGGHNHRMNLAEQVLIKENHLRCLEETNEESAVRRAVELARTRAGEDLMVEIEVETMAGLDAALDAGADLVLLDNMTVEQVRRAARKAAERRDEDGYPRLEASGGITLENVRDYAEAGADRISIGALTHSAPAMDLSLQLEL